MFQIIKERKGSADEDNHGHSCKLCRDMFFNAMSFKAQPSKFLGLGPICFKFGEVGTNNCDRSSSQILFIFPPIDPSPN